MAGFGGTPNLGAQEIGKRDLLLERIVDVSPFDADHPFGGAERRQTFAGKAAVTDKHSPGPCRLVELAVKRVEVRDADRIARPFGFEQVDLIIEQEAAVDLFPDIAERFARLEAEQIECALEKVLERKPRGCGARSRRP